MLFPGATPKERIGVVYHTTIPCQAAPPPEQHPPSRVRARRARARRRRAPADDGLTLRAALLRDPIALGCALGGLLAATVGLIARLQGWL